MKILIIHCLPNKTSFTRVLKNQFIFGLKENNHEITEIDLVQKCFDPIYTVPDHNTEDISVYREKIQMADVLVFAYPCWWFGMPAQMKGFIDRLFTPGFAFQYVDGKSEGLLTKIKSVYLISSMGVSFWSEFFNINGARSFYSNFKGIMNVCGIDDVRRIQAYGINSNTESSQARYYLEKAKKAGKSLS